MKREEYISDETVVKRAKEAVRIELEKKKALDVPIIIYDSETQTIYQEYSDGTRKEVSKRMKRGRYSEWIKEKACLKCSDLEAAQLAEKQREEHIQHMSEFCFETVLSTERNLNLLCKAKEKGYFIRCYYVLTADPIINIWRVKSRVDSGGHDVPKRKNN